MLRISVGSGSPLPKSEILTAIAWVLLPKSEIWTTLQRPRVSFRQRKCLHDDMTYELCNKSWFSRRLVKGKLQTAPRFWKFWGKTAWHQLPISSSRFRNTVWALITRVYFVQEIFKKAITVCFCFCQAGFLVTFCHQKVTRINAIPYLCFFGQILSAPTAHDAPLCE